MAIVRYLLHASNLLQESPSQPGRIEAGGAWLYRGAALDADPDELCEQVANDLLEDPDFLNDPSSPPVVEVEGSEVFHNTDDPTDGDSSIVSYLEMGGPLSYWVKDD